jgi:putative transposase
MLSPPHRPHYACADPLGDQLQRLGDTWHALLRGDVRMAAGETRQSSAAMIDSASFKTTEKRAVRGDDARKLMKGRKRHIVVETLGLLLRVFVTVANVGDRARAMSRLDVLRHRFSRLRLIWADQTYAGDRIG